MEDTVMRRTGAYEESGSRSVESTDSATEVSKVSIVVVGIFAAIVGLWSLACIIGGIAASGGITGLVAGWFKAVGGS